ncbi:ABC transporter ATP-binding protein [Chryseolinea lacunae]|uniref:ABC transporter ATP-binding protein n=1 Tax=Chryseolinea lacunae TaxID=2801331 RepID=A0ABS1KN97_9BACT|nr:ABC transporter ATP-binding protein [Chryseolinea lacunae]MBL0740727.1 ABC transporter ATP-binding protein [Chryseolinea lacunae]
MENPIIELRGLTKCYGSVKAVDDLNLNIQKGEIFGLLGPNGAGKTTTILMMLGLTDPTSGTAHVCGYNATTSPIPVKRKIGYMPDSLGFYDGMTALENLIYIGELNGISDSEIKDRARNVMRMVGLENEIDKKTSTYSRGMKQRLGLADVLIKQPDVLILDEPTLGIDPSGVKEFLGLIRRLSRQQGLTVLLSSHHLHHVQQVCDRVGIFVKGKLLVEGNMDTLSKNLFEEKAFEVSVLLRNSLALPWEYESEFLQLNGIKQVAVDGQQIAVTSSHDNTPEIVKFFVLKGYEVVGVQRKEHALDDIYQKYFEKSLNL